MFVKKINWFLHNSSLVYEEKCRFDPARLRPCRNRGQSLLNIRKLYPAEFGTASRMSLVDKADVFVYNGR